MSETPTQVVDDTPVIVSFTGSNERELRAHDIGQTQDAGLRFSFAAFEDWTRPK